MMTEYCVAFWNLENLFDEENSPRRSEKLQRTIGRELSGWTPSVLARKVSQLAAIIRKMNQERGPDLLGVCEVENRYVLELLVEAIRIPSREYSIAHFDTADQRGIDVAFLYDSRLFRAAEQFSHYIVKRNATRDLFQVNFHTVNDKFLIVIGNHWPSRTAGQYESEPYRILAGETLAYFHERIQSIYDKDVSVLALGDFNDEPHNRSLTDYALVERTQRKVTLAQVPKFLNLTWRIVGQGIGTHYYNNSPNVLDQFLASRGLLTGRSGLQIVPSSVEVVRFPEMVSPGSYPKPLRFDRGAQTNENGFSDHFPIAVMIREN
jgi:hypothetical protein